MQRWTKLKFPPPCLKYVKVLVKYITCFLVWFGLFFKLANYDNLFREVIHVKKLLSFRHCLNGP